MKYKFLRKNLIISLILSTCLIFTACGSSSEQTPAQPSEETVTREVTTDEVSEEETVSEEEAPAEEPVDDGRTEDKQVIVYFPNWNLDAKPGDAGGEVASIDWEHVTFINHAFWGVFPNDGTTETTFERRASGEGPRTEFTIKSTSDKADIEDSADSTVVEGLARNHFAEYEYFSEIYPDVNVLISIGGWTCSGYFSEMAYTEEGRKSFVSACIDLMKKYAWIDGIDIDWEYPGGSRDGERNPESDVDQGCPIWGTPNQDSENFALLLDELRNAMDENFGEGTKYITACASASTGWTLPMQNWELLAPHVDFVNVMTYDLAGLWDGQTGHASSTFSSKAAATYFFPLNVPRKKINIGSPMYCTTFLLKEITDNPLGAPIENYKPNTVDVTESDILEFEASAVSGYTYVNENNVWSMGETFDNGGKGWHMEYDTKKEAAYLYNDDETSPYYKWFLSYENHLSLQAKLDYINSSGISGIIVWESSHDTPDHAYISQMGDNLLK
ncbi:MAG: hypothetical protein J6033_03180 [Lachnospiraceae bacterium]|nr:hypothetical protein [Lachnospiraceae bacterium]